MSAELLYLGGMEAEASAVWSYCRAGLEVPEDFREGAVFLADLAERIVGRNRLPDMARGSR